MGTSTRTSWRSTANGAITAARPRITSTLNRFEPTTLPTTMPGSPRAAATMPVTSSGALVPKDDHGEADHQRADAQRQGGGRGAAHQQLGTDDEQPQPRRQHHDVEENS
jgi:hypothetical protein